MEKRNQTVQWYDYYWRKQTLTGQTIRNITKDEDCHIEGEWVRADGCQRVALIDSVWREI